MAMPPGFQRLLDRKYAILQQQADAMALNAQSNAGASAAAAALDRARASVIPEESEANIAQTRAQTGLIGQQAKYYGPRQLAEISGIKADTRATNQNADFFYRLNLLDRKTTQAGVDRVLGVQPSVDDVVADARARGYRIGQGTSYSY